MEERAALPLARRARETSPEGTGGENVAVKERLQRAGCHVAVYVEVAVSRPDFLDDATFRLRPQGKRLQNPSVYLDTAP